MCLVLDNPLKRRMLRVARPHEKLYDFSGAIVQIKQKALLLLTAINRE